MYQSFHNQGFILDKLTPDQMCPILEEINKIQDDFSKGQAFNDRLAGNILREYQLVDNFDYVQDLVLPYCHKYQEQYRHPVSQLLPLALNGLWVNFQAAGEFNPIHSHSGVFSFVIWVKIPYKIQEEIEAGPGKDSAYKVAGNFSFHYTDVLGEIRSHNIPVDSSMEHYIAVFPSVMKHSVNPFYSSKDYRITVAGNFAIQLPGVK